MGLKSPGGKWLVGRLVYGTELLLLLLMMMLLLAIIAFYLNRMPLNNMRLHPFLLPLLHLPAQLRLPPKGGPRQTFFCSFLLQNANLHWFMFFFTPLHARLKRPSKGPEVEPDASALARFKQAWRSWYFFAWTPQMARPLFRRSIPISSDALFLFYEHWFTQVLRRLLLLTQRWRCRDLSLAHGACGSQVGVTWMPVIMKRKGTLSRGSTRVAGSSHSAARALYVDLRIVIAVIRSWAVCCVPNSSSYLCYMQPTLAWQQWHLPHGGLCMPTMDPLCRGGNWLVCLLFVLYRVFTFKCSSFIFHLCVVTTLPYKTSKFFFQSRIVDLHHYVAIHGHCFVLFG